MCMNRFIETGLPRGKESQIPNEVLLNHFYQSVSLLKAITTHNDAAFYFFQRMGCSAQQWENYNQSSILAHQIIEPLQRMGAVSSRPLEDYPTSLISDDTVLTWWDFMRRDLLLIPPADNLDWLINEKNNTIALLRDIYVKPWHMVKSFRHEGMKPENIVGWINNLKVVDVWQDLPDLALDPQGSFG